MSSPTKDPDRLRVLVVEDDADLRNILTLRLEHWGYACQAAADVDEAVALLDAFEPDLVLSDVRMPRTSGLDLLRLLKSDGGRDVPVVLMTAHGTIDEAVEAMKHGAKDFLTKPVDDHRLKAVITGVISDVRRAREARALEQRLDAGAPIPGLVGQSEPMRELVRSVEILASSDASALISGESGTGKELVARAIHALSSRRSKPFIALNAAAIPETLIESELFGHERGAFTGALRDRAGCFELADGGTLFLDEIAEMPIALQPKLLRVIEDGCVRRLGSSHETRFDVRVIAATNRSPPTAVQDGLLREDLYYRLNIFEIVVPPLRDRLDDLPLLCQYFVREFNRKHGTQVEGLRESALECLHRYRWPGNVRELRNLMERAVIVAGSGWLEPSDFPLYVRGEEEKETAMLTLPIGMPAAEVERLLILKTLEHVGNNKAEAARRLGIDVKTIRNRLRGIEKRRDS